MDLPAGVTPVAIAAATEPARMGTRSAPTVTSTPGGDNTYGQLGDGGSGGHTNVPVRVLMPAGVTPTAVAVRR